MSPGETKGRAEEKFPHEVKTSVNRDTCPHPEPVYKRFYPQKTSSTLTPHGPRLAQGPPCKPPHPFGRPPHLPHHPSPLAPPPPHNFYGGCSGYHGEAWPIACPQSQGELTERGFGFSHTYEHDHSDVLTPSLSQKEETTAPAQCTKA